MAFPFSCDTSVVVGAATFDGSTIFAKNSDRSPNEAQPLSHYPRQNHAPGSTVQCQYIEIPEVEQTWEMIGSRPCWLWGFEIGVNEWGVAIGNEAVMTREADEELALIGMDIIRLALARSTTAAEATGVITGLVELYGQGGSCEEHSHRTYHNSFIVADPHGAFVVETAGHHWVSRPVVNRAAIGNLLTIDSPDDSSPGLVENAIERGWSSEPFSFAGSYTDPSADPATHVCRLNRSRDILASHQSGGTRVTDMMALLSDHNHGDLPAGQEPFPTLCMHANPAFPGETAAAMVAHLKLGLPKELTATIWTAFGSPCLSIFRPVYPFAVGLPPELDCGVSTYSADSPWWAFERFQRMIASAPQLAPRARIKLAELQSAFFREAESIEAEAAARLDCGDSTQARQLLRDFVNGTSRRSIDLIETLTREFQPDVESTGNGAMTEFWNDLNQKAGVLHPGLSISL